jgi:hypothetical protein
VPCSNYFGLYGDIQGFPLWGRSLIRGEGNLILHSLAAHFTIKTTKTMLGLVHLFLLELRYTRRWAERWCGPDTQKVDREGWWLSRIGTIKFGCHIFLGMSLQKKAGKSWLHVCSKAISFLIWQKGIFAAKTSQSKPVCPCSLILTC